MANILIVDDDPAMRDGIAETITDLGHHAITAANGRAALTMAAREKVEAVLLDLRMPDMSGLDVLRALRNRSSSAPPIAILTAFASASNTIEAMRLGAFDHLTKPVGRDDLADLIARMFRDRQSASASAKPEEAGEVEELVGSSASMREVHKTIGLVADSDATVLITGETGTGKEEVARSIHRHGRRSAGPFVAVNCAAIPFELLESELFGHVRGAFTGAVAERSGAFRDASGGTLFLDEIGDMALAMQAKILRALQERMVAPVGGRAVRVDARVIAATHRDLNESIRGGLFREDLYYRLNVIPISLPPLRDRPEDILPLANHFLREASDPPKALADDAASRLLAHRWPGNLRELRNAIERAVVLSPRNRVVAADLAFLDDGPAAPQGTPVDWLAGDLAAAVARLETAMIERALREAGGNRAEAARRLGIHRQLLYAKAQKYGLDQASPSGNPTGNVVRADKVRADPSKNPK